MSTDQPENEGRLTNSDILRELRIDSREQSKALAVLTTQVASILGMLASSEQKHGDASKRIAAHDQELVELRARLVNIEGHPAMTPDERAALKQQVVDHERRIATNETAIHDTQLRDFSLDDKDEIRRYLEIAKRRGVDDAFTPEETDAIRARIRTDARRGKWQTDFALGTALQVIAPIGVIIELAVAHFAGW